MEIGELKQHVPIFVGSTFEDLKDYRQATRDALSQLETIVRGMEYFGSKPGSPIEECLAAVRSCTVYIGIFGMRYGTIPEGHEKSMTHLEYDEAQRCNLDSLIYILDEDLQPVLPKFVEIGQGAESLRSLKEFLRKRHVISCFTTPEDLARRVLHDVPEVLRRIGTTVEGELPEIGSITSEELLRKFALLPKMFRGLEVTCEFTVDDCRSVDAHVCEALRLDVGATIRNRAGTFGYEVLYIYASNDLAEELLKLPNGVHVRGKGITVYGTTGEYDDFGHTEEHRGVSLRQILAITPPKAEKPKPT